MIIDNNDGKTPTLRSCVIAEQGYTFISLDASQIELRVLANLSQDQRMLEDLRTGDLHRGTALRIYGMPTEDEAREVLVDATQEQIDIWIADTFKVLRHKAKQGNFANVYGADEYVLATTLDCSVEEALEFQKEHRKTYPRLYEWMEEEKARVKEQGYVINQYGRIRPLLELQDDNWRIREKAEKEIINTLIQGTAVDTVKLAMLALRKIYPKEVRLVLQVHDEILWEVPDSLVKECLDNAGVLAIMFKDYPFTIKVGRVYSELEEVK